MNSIEPRWPVGRRHVEQDLPARKVDRHPVEGAQIAEPENQRRLVREAGRREGRAVGKADGHPRKPHPSDPQRADKGNVALQLVAGNIVRRDGFPASPAQAPVERAIADRMPRPGVYDDGGADTVNSRIGDDHLAEFAARADHDLKTAGVARRIGQAQRIVAKIDQDAQLMERIEPDDAVSPDVAIAQEWRGEVGESAPREFEPVQCHRIDRRARCHRHKDRSTCRDETERHGHARGHHRRLRAGIYEEPERPLPLDGDRDRHALAARALAATAGRRAVIGPPRSSYHLSEKAAKHCENRPLAGKIACQRKTAGCGQQGGASKFTFIFRRFEPSEIKLQKPG